MVFQESFKSISRKNKRCFKGGFSGFPGCFKEVQLEFQGSFKGVSRRFQGCSEKVSGGFKEVSWVFQKISKMSL